MVKIRSLTMKRWIAFLCVIGVFGFLTSCSLGRQASMGIVQDDIQDIDDFKYSADLLLQTWQLNSGLIKGALGTHFEELPAEVVQAIMELDELSKKWDAPSDYEYGYAMGLRLRINMKIIAQFIDKYAPYLLKKFSFLFEV